MEVCLYYSNCIKQVKSWNIRECQWCNRRVGEDPHPRDFWLGNFCWLTGKRQARKKGKWSRKEGKSKKRRWKLKKNEGGKVTKSGERTFYFCLFVCLFVLFLFSGFFSTFQNPWNLFWIYQNGNFLPGKSISRREKSGKITLLPLKKYSSYAPWDVLRRNY